MGEAIILAATITGICAIIAAIITGYYSQRVTATGRKTSSVKYHKRKFALPYLIALLSISLWLFFLINPSSLLNTGSGDIQWRGDWIFRESRPGNNGLLYIGSLHFQRQSAYLNDSILGVLYPPENISLSVLGITTNRGTSISGICLDPSGDSIASLSLSYRATDSFIGTLQYKSQKVNIIGSRFDGTFTHVIDSKSPTHSIGLRSRYLSNEELDEINRNTHGKIYQATLLGVLNNGDSIKVLERMNNQYRVLTRIKGALRVGYIASLYSGHKTINELGVD